MTNNQAVALTVSRYWTWWDTAVSAIPDDAFAAVAELPGVADAMARARNTFDPLLLDRRLRTHAAELAGAAALQNAHASATLEGADVPIAELSAGSLASPVLRVAAGVLEAHTALRRMTGQPARQVWAQLAAIVGREYLDDAQRGRPRVIDEPLHDPLHLRTVHAPDDVAVRLAVFAELLQRPTNAPALVVAAIAHAELVALQPFGAGNGAIARAYSHLVLAERGVDPDFFAMTDVGLVSLGRAAYVRAIEGYERGGEGVAQWCIHIATAFERGAVLTRQALDAMG